MSAIVATSIGIAAILSGAGLPALFAARVVASVCRVLVLRLYARSKVPELAVLSRPNRNAAWDIFQHGKHAGLISMSVIASHKMDGIIIAAFVSLSAVATYDVVFRLLGVTLQLCMKTTEGLAPIYARLQRPCDQAEAQRLFLRMSTIVSCVASTLLLVVVGFYDDLFVYLGQNQIAASSTHAVLVAAIPIIWSSAMQLPATPYLYACGHHQFLTESSIITAIANVLLSVLLVHPFGIAGVALGTLIPVVAQHQLVLIRKVRRELGIGLGEYMTHVHVKTFPGLAAAAAVIGISHYSFDKQTLALIAMASAAACLVSGLIWLIFVAKWSPLPFAHDALAGKSL